MHVKTQFNVLLVYIEFVEYCIQLKNINVKILQYVIPKTECQTFKIFKTESIAVPPSHNINTYILFTLSTYLVSRGTILQGMLLKGFSLKMVEWLKSL